MLLEISPDLRTAIATERLVIATWWLVGVGVDVATLLAAVLAAVAAVRAYLLEATPSIAFTGREDGFPATPMERPYVITRDHDLCRKVATTISGPRPDVVIRPFLGNAGDVEKNRQIAIEARNLGRTPVVEALVTIRLTVPAIIGYDEGKPRTAEFFYDGAIRIKAIAANESVIVPLINNVGSFIVEDRRRDRYSASQSWAQAKRAPSSLHVVTRAGPAAVTYGLRHLSGLPPFVVRTRST